MDINQAFPSKFLKAADLGTHTPTVEIQRVDLETMPDGNVKPVITFKGKDKGLVLNRINSATIAGAYGNETDQWTGKHIELRSEKVQGPSGIVDGIRVRAVQTMNPQPVAQEAVDASDDLNDDIPW